MNKINWNIYRFEKVEPILFAFVLVLNAIPVFSGWYFPTLDGPAHLYNANLIDNLLFSDYSLISQFFTLNQEPVPNWTGHLILSSFNLFLPGYIAEKILVTFYVIGLPIAFRSLVKTVAPQNILFSYLIVPFTYTSLFFLGFYNFSIALVFFFMTIQFWIKNQSQFPKPMLVVKLFGLIAITYFSHIFVFSILCCVIALSITLDTINKLLQAQYSLKEAIVIFFKKVFYLIIASTLCLVLFVQYFAARPINPVVNYLPTDELIKGLFTLLPLIALNFDKEVVYTSILLFVYAAMVLFTLYHIVKGLVNQWKHVIRSDWKLSALRFLKIVNVWFVLLIVMLVLYFTLPDNDGSIGYVSLRLGILLFVFLLLWLSQMNFPRWFQISAVLVTLFCAGMLDDYYSKATVILNRVVVDCNKASDLIKPNSIVYPLNYSNNWLTAHFSNYLGINKPIVILENYECVTGYFPLNWNEKNMPTAKLGEINLYDYPNSIWINKPRNPAKQVDYVFVMGSLDSMKMNKDIYTNIMNHYGIVYQGKYCTVYSIK